jgi:hypothetical protein
MKTMHSLYFAFFLLLFSFSTYANNPLPEVAAPKWEIKGQRASVNWTSSADQSDIVYVIEKSRDGKVFSTEMIVMGGFDVNNQFEFSCRFKYETGMQYRIKQMNNSGQYRVIDSKIF